MNGLTARRALDVLARRQELGWPSPGAGAPSAGYAVELAKADGLQVIRRAVSPAKPNVQPNLGRSSDAPRRRPGRRDQA